MDQEKNDARPQVCGKHNQQIILYDPDSKKDNLCLICVQQMTGLLINQSENYKRLFDISNNENDTNIQQFQNLMEAVQNHKQQLVGDLDKIILVISDQIKQLISFKQRLQNSNELNTNYTELELECLNQNKINHEVKNQLSTKLEDFKNQYFTIGDLLEGLNGKGKQIQLKQLNNQKKYEYQLIKQSIKKEERECSLFAFNQENTILVIVCKKKEQKSFHQVDHQILVYEFKNGQIIGEAQVLNDHLGKINCLYFMKKTNSFISGSYDNSIIFWEQDKTNHWIAKKQMKQNSGIINILMNEKEDLLILSSDSQMGNQGYISFLTKINENWICQDIVQKERRMIEMSLDNKENKLIALTDDVWNNTRAIYVFEKQKENKWVRAGKLIVNQNGYGLQFIKNNKFILQSTNVDFMEIFQFNQDLQNFKKVQQVEVQNCDQNLISFSCQFIQDLNFLTVKHGNYFNVFQADKEGNLQIIQTIQFYGNRILGKVTDNGEYLISWDEAQKEIQVRELKRIK